MRRKASARFSISGRPAGKGAESSAGRRPPDPNASRRLTPGNPFQPLLLDLDLAHAELLNLAAQRRRERIDKPDRLGNLEPCNLSLAELADLFGGSAFAGL